MRIELSKKKIQKLSRKILSNPIIFYLAGGVGAYFLGKTIYHLYLTNPKISNFIKNNILPNEKEGHV